MSTYFPIENKDVLRLNLTAEALIKAISGLGTTTLINDDRGRDNLLRESIENLRSNIQVLKTERDIYSRVMSELCRVTTSSQAFVLKRASEAGGAKYIVSDTYLCNGERRQLVEDEVIIQDPESYRAIDMIYFGENPKIMRKNEIEEINLNGLVLK